jgi:hypothetical protein
MRPLLIPFNIILSLIAFGHDFAALRDLPGWSVPFIAICPLMPLLLAAYWAAPHTRFAASLALPPAFFGLAALAFYPLLLLQGGWDWLEFGQIFWVWLYAVQGWHVLTRNSRTAILPGFAYVLACLLVLWQTKSYGFLAIDQLSDSASTLLALTLSALLVAITLKYRYLPSGGIR